MDRDSHKEELPPPTPEEEVVIRRILHRCLHTNTELSTARRIQYSTCLDCAEQLIVEEGETAQDIKTRWKTGLPRPASHLVVAEYALAFVGRSGWHARTWQSGDEHVCAVSKDERVARSKTHRTRAAAIVDALSQIAPEFRFKG